VLATDADVVFLDEPTLGLDVESSLTLRRELRRIVADRGLTAIVSSHDMDVVEAVCDRVIVLRDGRVIADDAVDALRRSVRRGRRIRVAASGDALDAGTIAAVRQRFEVTDVDARRSGTADAHESVSIEVEVGPDPDGIYDLLALLRDRGVALDSVDTVRPDLETAFLEMTRDEEDETEADLDSRATADVAGTENGTETETGIRPGGERR
jgi:ABC-2 type transport system ATP-binding protein